jgi:hypothetical protein
LVTSPPRTAVRPTSNCGLTSSTTSASAAAVAATAGSTSVEGDEGEVAHDEPGRSLPGRIGEDLRVHVPDVEALDGHDPGIRADGRRELVVPHVDGEHRTRTALAQHLRESAGRRAHVQREPPRRRCRTRRARR